LIKGSEGFYFSCDAENRRDRFALVMTVLDTIAKHVREEVEARKRKSPTSDLQDRPLFHEPTRDLQKALEGPSRQIIAEVKRASPSQGLIRKDFDPIAIAKDYANHGAAALSVLTEERFFQGNLSYLEAIRAEVPLPLLRKDFVLDSYQLFEARSFGADAVLLIAALLERNFLRQLHEESRSLSLDVLVEVHTEPELEVALEAGAQLVGINNRNLQTFEVNLETTEQLLPKVPQGIVVVCESGIEGRQQVERLEKLGVHVFLIGESLMRAPHPGAKLKELLEK
jgi:indole-3-glycerol phosphate synthase